jgi:hypothetical protein
LNLVRRYAEAYRIDTAPAGTVYRVGRLTPYINIVPPSMDRIIAP